MRLNSSEDLSEAIHKPRLIPPNCSISRGVQATSTTAPSMSAPHLNHGEREAPSACDSHNRYISSCWEWEHLRMEQNQCRNPGKY